MLKRLNDALPELVLGIIVYGIVVELAGGIALAVGMAVNMAIVLRDAVEIYGGEHAQAKIIAKSILRYVIVVIVFFVMMKFNLGNLFTAFIGVLGLKISAYLQPFTHKFVLKLQGRVETPSESSDN